MVKVVIIGGGYSGLYALKELVKEKNLKITLIDKHTYHNLQPEVYDLIANKSNMADVTIDLTSLCFGLDHPYLEYKNLKVSNIDLKNKIVYSEEEELIPYDYLIMAAGTRTFFPSVIEGLNNAEDIKKMHNALTFKQKFETELFKKFRDGAKICAKTHIVVVGAGLSGVEIAAEMAYNSRKFFQRGKFSCDNIDISLISSSDTILPGLSPKLIRASHNRLKELGINVITNTKLQKCEDGYTYLSNGTQIHYSFLIFTGGVEASSISRLLDIQRNAKGQILVNEYLQALDHPEVFAIGDNAEVKNSKGKIMPPNVTMARHTGISCGQNILRLIKNKKMKPCKPTLEGILIALGGEYAAGTLYDLVHVKGRIAYEIKKYVFSSYRAPLLKLIKKGYEKNKKS